LSAETMHWAFIVIHSLEQSSEAPVFLPALVDFFSSDHLRRSSGNHFAGACPLLVGPLLEAAAAAWVAIAPAA